MTEGGWVWLLNTARKTGISRIYLLVKQDENGFESQRTRRTLRSGELLAALPGETTAAGWENSDWLHEMLAKAKSDGIEVIAWWPLFNDAIAADAIPAARYAGPADEAFVDPAFAEVTARQETLLGKLLDTYRFDGVALDWIRYNARPDGSAGPLARKFETASGEPWTEAAMSAPLKRALWDDLRARHIATWTKQLVSNGRLRQADMKWSAFVLPWQFKEVAQSYRRLGEAGLDDLQPMIYWADWHEGPELTSEVLSGAPYWLAGRTRMRPTFDLNADEADTLKAISDLPETRLSGVVWYKHLDWSETDFARLASIGKAWAEAGAPVLTPGEEPNLDPPPPPVKRMGQRLEPAPFAPDASIWSVICLAELARLGALENAQTVVPVLTLHRFTEGDLENGANLWINSTGYLEKLLDYIVSAGFNVVPVSSVEAYMLSEDPGILPKRPLAISIDDGSLSILKLFNPLAEKRKLPYAVSLVTSLVKDGAERGEMEDYDIKDPILVADEVKTLAASGLVEFLSHSDNLHHWGPEDETGEETNPAMTTHLWREGEQRRETTAEYEQRVAADLARSRMRLAALGAKGPRILTWPYGEHNETADHIAASVGYSSFLEFGNSTFAFPGFDNRAIRRISVTRADETIPLAMPRDAIERQRWWLSFLKCARSSKSVDLIDAAIEQLEGEQQAHPEAELSRAAAEALRGHSAAALARIGALKRAYPHDGAIHAAIDELLSDYSKVL